MCDKNNKLRPIWDALIEIYINFSRLCSEYGLRHYVINGTAIGAVRHHGFVPWDDDFDVAMPREDYDKFVEIVGALPAHLKFVHWRNTPEYKQLFGKIQDTRRDKVEAVERKVGFMLSNGLFIDVFPIDGFPNMGMKYLTYKIQYQLIKMIVRFRLTKFRRQTKTGFATWFAGMLIPFFWPLKWSQHSIFSSIEQFAKSIPFSKSKNTGRVDSSLTFRYVYDKAVWGEPTFVEFENIKIPIPEKIDEYLRLEYGDYMQLPPENKRKPSHGYSWRCPWWLGPTKLKGDI